jgi:ABC-type polysaccharide/polyol phosphate transport system ATPase subunit
MNAVALDHVTKLFGRYAYKRRFQTLKSALLKGRLFAELKPDAVVRAVDDVTFSVKKGSTLGIIGSNGSGKSTLLKLLAGIMKPTSGRIEVDGRVSALIELGAGFHPEISGRENVVINGIMMGLSRREIEEKYEEIVRFSELQDFIEDPVKNYSSGMYVRLGFSVAVSVDPEVLLVDEVLAVGDEAFSHKCLDKFRDFKKRNKTIIVVSHSLDLIESLCDEAIWLEEGKLVESGFPRRVIDAYLTRVAEKEGKALGAEIARERAEKAAEAKESRWGSREIEIVQVRLLDASGREKNVFRAGEPLAIELSIRVRVLQEDFVFGVGIFNIDGVCCFGTNTAIEKYVSEKIEGEGKVTFLLDRLDLIDGTYLLDVAVHKKDGYPFDYIHQQPRFIVKSDLKDVGVFRPRHTWCFTGNISIRQAN